MLSVTRQFNAEVIPDGNNMVLNDDLKTSIYNGARMPELRMFL